VIRLKLLQYETTKQKTMNRILFSFFIFIALACTEKEQPREMEEINQGAILNETQIPDTSYTYLALGDSYTIGESVLQEERFPVQLETVFKQNGYKMDRTKIVAKTGWTTDELASGIKNETLATSYNLVTLLIGVNNQYRGRDSEEYRIQFKELLETAISFATNNPQNVIVISIPDYGATPFAASRNPEKIGKEIDLFNKINREETQYANARYVDITPISKQAKDKPELVAADGLHPSKEMYRLWVEQIFPKAKEIVESQK